MSCSQTTYGCDMRTVSGVFQLDLRKVILGLFLLLWFLTGCVYGEKNDPVYCGRPLSTWVDILGNHKAKVEKRKAAAQAIQAVGTNALPFLVSQIKLGSAIDGQRRMGVVAALEALGDLAKPALPALIEITITGDERSAETALWAMSRMGEAGVEAMSDALANSKGARQRKIVQMLHSMGTKASSAVPALLSYLSKLEDDYDTAFWAGCAAATATRQPEEVIPILTTNLLRGSSACRYGSASGLCLLGSRAKEAVPTLRILLSDTNGVVRYAASNALWNIERQLNVAH